MRQRLLVMNGQRIVQDDHKGAWASQKVDKASGLKPGIYNLYTAQKPDKSQRHDGVIVHADNKFIYQQKGKTYVMHSRSDFDIVPPVGGATSITYDSQGKAQVSSNSITHTRGRSR
ncbi:IncP plasmid survival protein KfrB [Hahella ganghwensis]|uniref:IncP plasmid survival protein KfrB n=1 Tax=Hahella ganghwensis TaxID=286420 RepID=UPI0003696F78|nr:IncP plasmid survival protein KfrB [Hahella ganghwensis]